MATVIGVKFKNNVKCYYFDPAGVDYEEGDGVIVETQRGIEYGTVAFPNREVDDGDVVRPLKPALRRATDKDTAQHMANLSERTRLIEETRKKAEAHGLKMKIADAEYTFDRGKVIIYFTADGRIDFRELVRDLAGLFLKDYEKVSIRMAKNQGLSLNPQKISGCCGKLMCCLRYENQYYQDMAKKMPKVNSTVDTPEGRAVVLENDALKQEVRLRFTSDDGSVTIKSLPLSDLKFSRGSQPKEEPEDPADMADSLPDEE